MAKDFFKKYSPTPEKMENVPGLRYLAPWLKKHPYLYHFNRRSVSRGVFFGIISAMIPFLLQPLYCILFCIFFRANVLVAMFFVLITNPLTAIPVFYFCYKLGATILDTPIVKMDEGGFGLDWIWANYQPLFLGSMLVGITVATIAYFAVDYVWKRNVRYQWKKRIRERLNRLKKDDSND